MPLVAPSRRLGRPMVEDLPFGRGALVYRPEVESVGPSGDVSTNVRIQPHEPSNHEEKWRQAVSVVPCRRLQLLFSVVDWFISGLPCYVPESTAGPFGTVSDRDRTVSKKTEKVQV